MSKASAAWGDSENADPAASMQPLELTGRVRSAHAGDVHSTFSGRLRSRIVGLLPRARGLDVALDFDGTLVPIVPRPHLAVLGDRVREAILRLAALEEVRVAVMSGRRLDDLESRTALPGVHLVGLAGIESRDSDGARNVHGRRRVAEGLIEELEAWCRSHHGSWVENKGLAVSVHHRAVPPARRAAFIHGLIRRLAPHRAALEITHGLMVHELRPAGSPTKGDALERWIGDPDDARVLIYLGDDANDRPALALVRRLGGVPVCVGPRHVPAPEHLAGPRAAMEFIEWLADAWQSREKAARGAITNGRATPSRDSSRDRESGRRTPGEARTAPTRRSDRSRSPAPRDR